MSNSFESAGDAGNRSAVQDFALGVAPEFPEVIADARLLWKDKTALHLAAITGSSERTVKYWLANRHIPSGPAATKLLAAVRDRLRQRLQQYEGCNSPGGPFL